jgi:hypothetical protein
VARKKTFNAMAQVVCVFRGGSRTSVGLSTLFDIRATTKRGAEVIAKRTWRQRGELPVPGMKHKASCKIHPSVEEAY